MRLGRLITMAIFGVVAGCAAPANAPSEHPVATLPGSIALQFTCGRFPFPATLLTDQPGHAQDAATPLGDALRRGLAEDAPDRNFLPPVGWTLVGSDAAGAEFVTVDGDLGLKSISFENGAAGWKAAGWGDCRPNLILPEGIGTADWVWDDAGRPTPATQTFTARVTERACASGRAPIGRIVGPVVVPSADTVLVIFGVRSQQGTQTCPGNPGVPVPVDLGVPLGDRHLLDGGHLPYGDPTAPHS